MRKLGFLRRFIGKVIKMLLAFFVVIHSTSVHALDGSPRDYQMFPVGHSIYAQYLQFVDLDGVYVDGVEQTDLNAKADLTVGISRYIFNIMPLDHMVKGLTVDPQIFVPYGGLDPKGGLSGLDNSNGMGDALFLAAFKYPINKEKRHFIGFTPYLEIPTGDYEKNRLANLGNNRYSTTLQVGWTREFFHKNVTLGLTADVQFFGTNSNYRSGGALAANLPDQSLKQEELYQYQAHLSYDVTPKLAMTATYSTQHGGEELINGVKRANSSKDKDKYRVGFQYFIKPNLQLEMQYGKDLKVDNGFKEKSRVNMRLAYIF